MDQKQNNKEMSKIYIVKQIDEQNKQTNKQEANKQ